MHGNSKIVTSSRTGIHENLEKLVRKHFDHEFLRPFAQHTLDAYQELLLHWQAFSTSLDATSGRSPLILDACCGTARSTVAIAEQHPKAFVVGIDQSIHRLSKQHLLPSNAVILQANLLDLYRIMARDEIKLYKHFLLYPNPWPKAGQLKRRWHAMPCFPAMVKLAGTIEVRSNWPVYIDEFAEALKIVGFSATTDEIKPNPPITAFEEKYLSSGQTLYRLQANLTTDK